jgi:hypothetical protein
MKFSVAATAAFLAVAEARIYGIAVPDVIKPGEGFSAIILTENFIQSVYDVAIVFGYKPVGAFPDALGTPLASFHLGPGKLLYFFLPISCHVTILKKIDDARDEQGKKSFMIS